MEEDGGMEAARSKSFLWVPGEAHPQWFLELSTALQEELQLLVSIYEEAVVSLAPEGAKIRLRLDGANTLVKVILTLPREYPKGPPTQIALRCSNLLPEVVQDLQWQLQREANDQNASGMNAEGAGSLVILGRATELVQSLPLALQVAAFVCCVACNQRLVRMGRAKVAQPARSVDESGTLECLACHRREVIACPAMFVQHEEDMQFLSV